MGIFTDSPAFAKETIKQHLEGTILGADCLQLREIKEKKIIMKHLKCGKCHILRRSLACYWIVGQAFCVILGNSRKNFQKVCFSKFLRYFTILTCNAASCIYNLTILKNTILPCRKQYSPRPGKKLSGVSFLEFPSLNRNSTM